MVLAGLRTALVTLSIIAAPAPAANGVLIHSGTPDRVTSALRARLEPQNFRLDHADKHGALFLQDRGMVAQRTGGFTHVVMELRFQYKQKPEGLIVDAVQTLTGRAGPEAEFRREMDTPEARTQLTALLEQVRGDVEQPAGDAAAPPAARADSARP